MIILVTLYTLPPLPDTLLEPTITVASCGFLIMQQRGRENSPSCWSGRQKLDVHYPLTQCAAVRSQRSLIMEAPHRNLDFFRRAAWYGYWPSGALDPPISLWPGTRQNCVAIVAGTLGFRVAGGFCIVFVRLICMIKQLLFWSSFETSKQNEIIHKCITWRITL